MAEALPLLATGTMGAEEEARSIIGSIISQIITLVRNVLTYVLEYVRKFLTWAGEHPLAVLMTTVNFMIWVS